MQWYLYILECRDNSFYIGTTTNLNKRLQEHNSGKGAVYTRGRYPVKIIHQETYACKSLAQKREAQLKRWSRAKKEALIRADRQTLQNLAKSKD